MGKLNLVFPYGEQLSASSLFETEKIDTRSTANDFGFSFSFSCSGTVGRGATGSRGGAEGLLCSWEACLMTLEGGGENVCFELGAVDGPPTRVA